MGRKIQEAWTEDLTHYSLSYSWKNDSGAGFEFDCDQDGTLREMHPSAAWNLQQCINGTFEVNFNGIKVWPHSYRHAAIMACDRCGHPVTLDSFTCTCDGCGSDYNSAGQLLAPRSQWGQETGESYSDIMSGFDPEEIGGNNYWDGDY